MAGHNPHGRLGQPNAPWNHLQVPSFIPRQPQLAHMSNEPRPLNVRSPLAWHAPAHSDAALYNYMAAATHKTPLDINPLLPAFVRPPSNTPFGSVDLSIGGAASRHNATPSPRNVASPANATTEQNHSMANNSVIQSVGNSHEIFNPLNNCNGDGRSSTSPQLLSNATGGHFSLLGSDLPPPALRDFHPLHDSLQLVKEAIHNSLRQHAAETEMHDLTDFQPTIFDKPRMPDRVPDRSTPTASSISPPSVNNFLTTQSSPFQAPVTPTKQSPNFPNQRSPSSALQHSNSSCSSTSSSSSSISTAITDLTHPPLESPNKEDKSPSRRRNRKPIKTSRRSNSIDDHISPNDQVKDYIELTPKKITNSDLVCGVSKEIFRRSPPDKLSDGQTNLSFSKQSDKILKNGLISHTIPTGSPTDNGTQSNQTKNQTRSLTSDTVTQHPDRRKSTPPPDEFETIDNIAAELAKSNFAPTTPRPSSRNSKLAEIAEPPTNISSPSLTTLTESLYHKVAYDCPKDRANGESLPEVKTNGINAPSPKKSPAPANQDTNQTEIAKKSQTEAIYEEVENKLEEMFAGIEDDRPFVADTILVKSAPTPDVDTTISTPAKPSKKTSTPAKASAETTAKKTRKPVTKKAPKLPAKAAKGKKGRKPNLKAANSKSGGAAEKKGKSKESSSQEPIVPPAIRGPLVHVDLSGATQVINAPITEEVAEAKAKIKKGFIVGPNQSTNAGDSTKIRGMHRSTLSSKYDADTTDTTWMCVFCKLGPHRFGLGDLFGPYIVSTDCEEFRMSQSDPKDDTFRGHHKRPGELVQRRSLPDVMTASGSGISKKKRKTLDSPQEPPVASTSSASSPPPFPSNQHPFHGMVKASDTSYEVWMHGDCAVWSSGVHIIGTRIVGLEAAVWSSSGHQCVVCYNYGAMLSCLQRGCADEVHVPCARNSVWTLNEQDFKSRCLTHSSSVRTNNDRTANTTTTSDATTHHPSTSAGV